MFTLYLIHFYETEFIIYVYFYCCLYLIIIVPFQGGTEDTVQQTTPSDNSSIMPPSPGSFITQREKLRDHFKKHLSQDDRYDLLGKSVACRIKALANRQRLIVEKRINDILFEADMGMLNTPTDFNNFGSSSSTSNPSPSANATLYDLNSHQTKVSDLRTQEEPTHTLAIYFREFSDGI
nr:unnamed protein product [Callosobruchus analis]